MIEKIEKGILSKRLERDEVNGLVTIHVIFQTPTRNNEVAVRTYTERDAQRWLEDGGFKIESCVRGGRVNNRDPKSCSTRQSGSWTFKLWVEPEVPVVESTPARKAKVVAIRESTSTGQKEFEGLNFDGTAPQIKKTAVKRKISRKRK
jgi:hypothetical protein